MVGTINWRPGPDRREQIGKLSFTRQGDRFTQQHPSSHNLPVLGPSDERTPDMKTEHSNLTCLLTTVQQSPNRPIVPDRLCAEPPADPGNVQRHSFD